MRHTFSCSSIDSSCPATLVSDTDVELLDQIHRHIEEKHPEMAKAKLPSPEKLRQAIQPKT